MIPPTDPRLVDAACAAVRGARRVTVLSGAGLSTDSGIPDFRGPNGVWTRDPAAERASTLSCYLAEPEVRRAAWRHRVRWFARDPRHNDGHRAIVALERRGVLRGVVTQNVDGLHQRAGNDPSLVHEVHGSILATRCWGFGERRPMTEALERVAAGDADPPCLACGGILKSDTILFGQSLDEEVLAAALAASEDCDVLLTVGSTLSVYPAANCVPRARAAGARVVIVNGEATEMDHLAEVVLVASLSAVLPAICAA